MALNTDPLCPCCGLAVHLHGGPGPHVVAPETLILRAKVAELESERAKLRGAIAYAIPHLQKDKRKGQKTAFRLLCEALDHKYLFNIKIV